MEEKKKRKKWPFFVAGGVLVLGSLGFYMYHEFQKLVEPEENVPQYETTKVKKLDPLIFKGIVVPKDSQSFFVDASLGKLKTIAVKDQQTVKEGDVLFTYENEEVMEQVSQQSIELQKANLSLGNIQDKLATEKGKLDTLYGKYNHQQQKVNQVPNDKEHQEELEAEKATLEGINSEISAQQEGS